MGPEDMDVGEEKLYVRGPQRMQGELLVQGSKNAVLPILAATLLGKGRNFGFATNTRITAIPRIMIAVLKLLVPTSPAIGRTDAMVRNICFQDFICFSFRLIRKDSSNTTVSFANSDG